MDLEWTTQSVDAFWISIMQKYPPIAKNQRVAAVFYIPLGFSFLYDIKSKKRERLLSVEKELRVCLSHIQPNIAAVVQKSQAHVSH